MAAKEKRFTVLALGDLDNWGFNEHTLPILIGLVKSEKPDYLDAIFSGVTGYFFTSPQSARRVESVIQGAEKLRDNDERFSKLGIGLAEGRMLAEFNWWGDVKKSGTPPLGQVANDAVKCSHQPNGYREKLEALLGKATTQTS